MPEKRNDRYKPVFIKFPLCKKNTAKIQKKGNKISTLGSRPKLDPY